MGDVLVKQATLADNRIQTLSVGFDGLPDRQIDRETALAWMRDGHSLVPVQAGKRLPALLLIYGSDGLVIRDDSLPESADSVPSLG